MHKEHERLKRFSSFLVIYFTLAVDNHSWQICGLDRVHCCVNRTKLGKNVDRQMHSVMSILIKQKPLTK